ncbi:MAG TPA: GH25 family lysozyme [Polyangia bacterium]
MRKLAAFTLVFALSACSAPPVQIEEVEGALVSCPGPNKVQGIDVSEFQGSINWSSVKASGRQFAIARVDDGTYLDPDFATNWAGMKSAGMIRGAYQFFRASDDPIATADILLNRIGTLGPGDLAPTLDVEVTDGQSVATIIAHMKSWLSYVKQKTGRTPMIYTAPGFWSQLGNPDLSQYTLWVANWQVNCPSLPGGWSSFKFWQYADNGSVPGISGAVDLDEFNGSLADLQVVAGGADWGAAFVSQSFPYATTAIPLTVGQDMAATITLRNIGSKSWDSNTKLGTSSPRDRSSPFAGADWLAPNRAAAVKGTVAPGASYAFKFTFHAPMKAGTYTEYFDPLEEGVHWFSDPGEGGPPDNQLEAKFVVTEAPYHAAFVAQSYPTTQQGAEVISLGQTVEGYVDLKNLGTATWKVGTTKLAPTPRDQDSAFASPSWLSPTRASTVMADTPPGQVGRFPLELTGNAEGTSTATFSLVEEGVTWFADEPKGAGPADNGIKIKITVGPANSTPDGGTVDTDAGSTDSDGGVLPTGTDDGGGPPAANPPDGGTTNGATAAGCSVSGSATGNLGLALLVLLALIALRRRSEPQA